MKEHIILHSELMKYNWQDEEWISKMREVSSRNMRKLKVRQLNDPEYKKFLSDVMRRRWKDGEFDYQCDRTLSDEHKEKISVSLREKYKNDVEWSTKQKKTSSERATEYWIKQWADPEKREKMVVRNRINAKKLGHITAERNIEMWKDPNHREKVSKAVAERNVLYGKYKRSEYYKIVSYKDWKSTYNHKVVMVETIQLETPVPVYDIEVPKTSNFALESGIFVHNSRGDWTIATWNKDARGRIATAFCISGIDTRKGDASHDGRIWRAFPEEYWAYHLGQGLSTPAKYSIGIEICNYGYLYKGKDGNFYNYANGLVPKNQVVELAQPFRGHIYWHRYTDKQVESTYYLLKSMGSKFGIDLKSGLQMLIPNGEYNAFEYNQDAVKGASGVWSHTNVRKDKTDISPQPHMVDMIMSL